MRVVSAAEAVAGIQSGEQVYVHCAAAAPSVSHPLCPPPHLTGGNGTTGVPRA